jgi:hypothetical protein
MTRRTATGWKAAGLAVLLVAGGLAFWAASAADTAGKWLHVRVVGDGDKNESVRVNLPIAVLETMAESIQAEHFKEGQVHLGDTGLKAAQLRAAWESIRTSKDMEFVTIDSDDENVRVAKAGRHLVIKVNEGGARGRRGTVDVKLPIEVMDALLDAPEGQLNVKAAIQALVEFGTGDIVQVHDGTSRVRIWIDDSSASDI